MSGRWTVRARGSVTRGRPWLVLRGRGREAVCMGGGARAEQARATPARTGHPRATAGPRSDGREPPSRRRRPRGRRCPLDQRLVAGIGNMWKAEALWRARVSPGLVGETSDRELRAVLEEAARLMRAAVETGREERVVYRRAGRLCPRCRTPIESRGQGDANRTAYWCPVCQPWKRRGDRARKWTGDPVAEPARCARSASGPSRPLATSSTTAETSRSRSRSTRRPEARRFTSTGRW